MLPIVKNTNVIAPGMYKVHTKPTQTRTHQLHQDIRKPNKRVSFFTGVIPNTRVSIPQLKSNHLEDRVMSNYSQGKKQEVEDHRTVKFGNDQIAPILGYGDLVQGNDLLIGSRGTDLYSITLQDSTTPNPICLMAKATSSQAWLWHLEFLNGTSHVVSSLQLYLADVN
ncbi:hypothetical protein Tco_0864843 [Tanacetum coccineum]